MSRARSRFLCAVAISYSVILPLTSAFAAEPRDLDSPSAMSAAHNGGIALELDEAQTLAVTGQPLLEGLSAQARAERESAVASGQLPDPQLFGGIQDLPVNTGDAGSFTRDSDTQIVVGVMQEFPRAAKRRLRGALNEREADRLDAEHHLAQRSIRRDAALSWLELWRYDQARMLNRASLREAEAQTQAMEIALKTGTATQAELLAARVEAGRLPKVLMHRRSVQALSDPKRHRSDVLGLLVRQHTQRYTRRRAKPEDPRITNPYFREWRHSVSSIAGTVETHMLPTAFCK